MLRFSRFCPPQKKVLNVSEESRRWVEDPRNRKCDAPGPAVPVPVPAAIFGSEPLFSLSHIRQSSMSVCCLIRQVFAIVDGRLFRLCIFKSRAVRTLQNLRSAFYCGKKKCRNYVNFCFFCANLLICNVEA